MVAFNAAARVRCVQSQRFQIRQLRRRRKADYSRGFQHIKWGCFIKKAPRSWFSSAIRAPTDWIFFLHIKVVVLSETPEMFLKIEHVLTTFHTLFMRTLLQQGHTDGHFLFTNSPAFYLPSIQL